VTEQQTVLLRILVTQLRHILVDNRVAFAKINDFHHITALSFGDKGTNMFWIFGKSMWQNRK
jgi:hypothetical protein